MANLGDRVKDKVTGFEGIVIGKSKWLNNCDTVGVKGKVKEDGTVPEAVWFDEMQVEVIEENVIKRVSQNTGGFGKNETPKLNGMKQ